MNITYVYFKDVFSYSETSLRVDEDGLYALIGKNGSGKSSFREAITWCLFGECRYDNRSKDFVIRQGAQEAIVVVEMVVDDKAPFIVRRTAKRGGTGRLTTSRFTGQTIKESQDYIHKTLGMTYDVFRVSACFEQGASNSFSKMSPKEAKEAILRILQLNDYERLYEEAKVKLRDLNNRREVLEVQDSSATTEQVKQLQYDMSIKSFEQSTVEQSLKVVSDQVVRLKGKVDEQQQEKDKVGREVETLRVTKLVPIETRLRDLTNQRGKVASLVKSAMCPTCLQPINKTHSDRVLQELDSRIAKGMKLQAGVQKQIEDKVAFLEFQSESKEEGKYREVEQELRELDSQNQQLLRDIAELKGMYKAMETQIETTKNAVKELAAVVAEATVYEELVKAFGKDGIPSYIIENVRPEIESIANKVLKILTGGRFQIAIATQRDLKSGGKGDTLDITIADGPNTRPYFGYSGGEQFLIDFSLRIALSVLLSNRHNAKVQTLIIDEGLGSLDDANRGRFVKTVQEVFKQFSFKKCFLITHASDVQEVFDNRVVITKQRSGSVIEDSSLELPPATNTHTIVTDSMVDGHGRMLTS